MYFPRSRKFIVTASLITLSSIAGCTMNRCYLPGMSRYHYDEATPSQSHMSPDAIPQESAPTYVTPDNLEKTPLTPATPARPMGPQLPGEALTDPQPEPFPAETLPNVESVPNSVILPETQLPKSETPESESLESAPSKESNPQGESPKTDSIDTPPSPVPEGLESSKPQTGHQNGLQTSAQNPGLFEKIRGGIPRIERKPTVIAATRQRAISSDSYRPSAQATAMSPIPDPISSVPRAYRKPSTATVNHSHNYPKSRYPDAETITIESRKPEQSKEGELSNIPVGDYRARGVSYQQAVADYLRKPADYGSRSATEDEIVIENESGFEFDFATPPSPAIEPELWPYSPQSR